MSESIFIINIIGDVNVHTGTTGEKLRIKGFSGKSKGEILYCL